MSFFDFILVALFICVYSLIVVYGSSALAGVTVAILCRKYKGTDTYEEKLVEYTRDLHGFFVFCGVMVVLISTLLMLPSLG